MSQSEFPEHNQAAGTVQAKLSEAESETQSQMTDRSPLSYSVLGAHARVRADLLWVCKLLASDQNNSVSVILVRDLRRALSDFAAGVRVQDSAGAAPPGSTGGATPSPSGESRRVTRRGNSVKNRTRNFKA